MKIIKRIFLTALLFMSTNSDCVWAARSPWENQSIKPEDSLASPNRRFGMVPRYQGQINPQLVELTPIANNISSFNIPSFRPAGYTKVLQSAHLITNLEELLFSEFFNRTVITVEEGIKLGELQTSGVLKAARSAFVDVNSSLPWRR